MSGGLYHKSLARVGGHPRLLIVCWVGFWIASFIATHVPREAVERVAVPVSDKVIHFLMYFLLTLMGGRVLALRGRRLSTGRLAFWLVVYLAYGAFDELTQIPVGRHASLYDWLADALGVLMATSLLTTQISSDGPAAEGDDSETSGVTGDPRLPEFEDHP